MISRRSFVVSGIAGAAIAGSDRLTSVHAHAASTPDGNTQQYQGILAIQDLPTLPTAPEGECTIVLEAFGPKKSVAVVYHNASDQVMAINRVSAIATSKYGTETPSVPEESNHGPHLLQPGE